MNDPSSQFAYLLARGANSGRHPQTGCGCAVVLFALIAVAGIVMLAHH